MDKNIVLPGGTGMDGLVGGRYAPTYNGAYGPVAHPYSAPKSDWIAPGQPQTVEVPKQSQYQCQPPSSQILQLQTPRS